MSTSRIGARPLAALLPDLRTQPGPVYVALSDAITALVLDGRVAPHTRLPSERELAAELQVSRATVTAAYDELRAAGFLASRTGAGSFVTIPAGRRRRHNFGFASPSPDGDLIDMAHAALPAPPEVLGEGLAAAAEALPAYAMTDGYDPAGIGVLRAAIAARFEERGVPTDPDQIIVTNGAQHGLNLVFRLLLGPGDRALVELPTYPGALDAIKAASARAVPVPMAATGGWDVPQLAATLRQTSPRVAYLIPDFHNPTGALMPESARREVLKAARRTGTTVIVDESFVELGFCPGEPAAAALDTSVITLGSLSKPVWGGLRIGWVRASAETVHRLATLRAALDMSGPVLDQLVATHLFDSLDEITETRRGVLLPRRDALLAAVAQHFPQWRVTEPAGGLSSWIELDAPLSTPLALLAPQAGVAIVPGSRFGVDGTLERFLRLPFAQPEDRIRVAVQRLAAAWAQLDRGGAGLRQLVVA